MGASVGLSRAARWAAAVSPPAKGADFAVSSALRLAISATEGKVFPVGLSTAARAADAASPPGIGTNLCSLFISSVRRAISFL